MIPSVDVESDVNTGLERLASWQVLVSDADTIDG
jgi:hypothetical protein